MPKVAAKCARARWVISLRDFSWGAWRVTDRDEWKRRSLPRCTSSLRRLTSSRAISASGDMVRPRRRDKDWADSNFTFCHSNVRDACSAGIDARCMERSMGIPAAMRLCRNPGANVRGHLPRCSDRMRWSPMRMSRRLTSISTWVSSSISFGEPPRAEAKRNIRSVRPVRGCTERPALARSDRSSSARW